MVDAARGEADDGDDVGHGSGGDHFGDEGKRVLELAFFGGC